MAELCRTAPPVALCQNHIKGDGVTLIQTLAGMGLLGVALNSAALSLGATTAVPLIGRPLNITLPVATDGSDDLCLRADVLYADSPVAPAQVTTQFEATGKKDGLIRLRSSKAVDEPVVTVEVSAGCVQRVSRRYVLLADVGEEVVLPSLASGQVLQTPAQPVVREAQMAPRSLRSAPSLSTKAGPPNARPNRATAANAAQPGVSGPVAGRAGGKSTPVAKARNRLKLSPADFAFERNPALKLSLELTGQPAGGEAERAAAAALWRVLNLDVNAALGGLEKITALETELRTLRAAKAESDRALGSLKADLALAQSQRYANLLVYSLVGLVLLLAALLAWRWRSTRHQAVPWAPPQSDDPVATASSSYLPAAKQSVKETAPTGTGIDLDMMASLFPEQDADAAASGSGKAAAPHTDFGDSLSPSRRGVKAEELLDIQQQADFFVSLGQHDQAITVLRSYIRQSKSGVEMAETSPMAYLDLLRLYHTLNRRQDYQLLREDFNQAFHVHVPEFDDYRQQSQGLLAYPEVMSRIVVAWPRPAVLPLIEDMIFKRPDSPIEAFDLEACRDLLLLYAVAKERIAEEDAPLAF